MRDKLWVIDYISFTCMYCSAPFEKPQDLINHKKEKHLDKIGSRLCGGSQRNSRRNESKPGVSLPNKPARQHGQGSSVTYKQTSTLRTPSKQIRSRGQHYGCNLCRIKFTSFKEVVAHKRSKHPHLLRHVGEFNCPHCHAKYNEKKNYTIHLKLHSNAKISKTDFPCGDCKKRFLSEAALQNHAAVYHDENRTTPTNSINRQSVSKQSSQETTKCSSYGSSKPAKQKINLPARYAEEGLDSDSGSEDDLPADKLISCPSPNQFKCQACPRTYKNSRTRRKHERLAHNLWVKRGRKTGIAPRVKIKFPQHSINRAKLSPPRQKHSSASPERRFTCHFCKQTYETMTELLIHAHIHGNYSEPKRSLKKPSMSPRGKLKISYANRLKRTCNYCSDTFMSASSLLSHNIREHSEYRLQCSECPASFARKGELSLHQLEHAGIKPHSCQFCGHQFTRHGVLARHTRREHSMEKQFFCKICDNVSRTANSWILHCRIHSIDRSILKIGK